jgi:hypothetical protein
MALSLARHAGCIGMATLAVGGMLVCTVQSTRSAPPALMGTREVTVAPGAAFSLDVELPGAIARGGRGSYDFRAGGPAGGPAWSFGGGSDGVVRGGNALGMSFLAPTRPGRYTLTGRFPGGFFAPRLKCRVTVVAEGEVAGPAPGLVVPAPAGPGGGPGWDWGPAGPLAEACSVTALADGSVLLAGGWGPEGREGTDAALRYWPHLKRALRVGPMEARRVGHEAVRLRDGRVLLLGGGTAPGGEVFDPATNRFRSLGPVPGDWPHHRVCVMADGGILAVPFGVPGGPDGATGGPRPVPFLLDPGTLAATPLGSALHLREAPTLTALRDGRVLVVGAPVADGDPGAGAGPEPGAMAELFDPVQGLFLRGPATRTGRRDHRAVPLRDGRVLLLGGWISRFQSPGASGAVKADRMECFDPAKGTFTDAGPLESAHPGRAMVLQDGSVLLLARGRLLRLHPGAPGVGAPTEARLQIFPEDAALLPGGQVLLVGPSPDATGIFYP